MKRRLSRTVAVSVALALLGGCAPRLSPPGPPDLQSRAALYGRQLAERRALGRSLAADLSLWIERDPERRLPGAHADLMLAGPDRLRLRVGSMFGTALDLGLRGDSLTAYVPSWRTGLTLGSTRDSIGLRSPGGLAYRVFAAAWDPPAAAWALGRARDGLVEVDWAEGRDSLTVAVSREGAPAWVRLRSDDPDLELRVRYLAWDRVGRAAWPGALALEDLTHEVKARFRASRLRFEPHPDAARLEVRVPDRASVLTLAELRTVLDRLGVR